MREIFLADDAATRALGRALARALPDDAWTDGAVLCLSGHLGAGKTTLVKGFAAECGLDDERDVTSPTFLRVVRHEQHNGEGRLPLVHVDAYRMQGPDDVFELGLDEDLSGGGIVLIEWPERIAAAIPRDHLRLELDHRPDGGRTVRLAAGGARTRTWLDRWESGSSEA